MTRKCSHCSHNGHNSRTCPTINRHGIKLFGVRLLTADHGSGGSSSSMIRKSASMGNLSMSTTSAAAASGNGNGNNNTPRYGTILHDQDDDHRDGYASEDLVAAAGSSSSSSARQIRKRGVPWTEEEHRMFLLGLQKLGKGDWRGIARTYVVTRTPTQVASHAQKYFIRQTNVSRRKRRSSLFDLVHDESVDTPLVSRDFFSMNPPEGENQSMLPSVVDEECESMESANSNEAETMLPNQECPQYQLPCVYPAAYVAPIFSLPIPFWPSVEPVKEETHKVVKPTAVHSKSPINVDELVGMSNLSLGEAGQSNHLSLKLVEGSSNRPSAFHANNPASARSSIHVI